MGNSINPLESKSPNKQPPVKTAPTKSTYNPPFLSGKDSDMSLVAVLFDLLTGTMTIEQQTLLRESKQINLNADEQANINKLDGDIKFSVLPPGAKNPTINRYQELEQQKTAYKTVLQNKLLQLRQTAQVTETQVSMNMNYLQQTTSQGSGWLKILFTIFKVINNISPQSQ